ncbi:kinase-like domain-containing protein [Chiua virens]|nr:kinase-like domain-containing protein [Chiua virens]
MTNVSAGPKRSWEGHHRSESDAGRSPSNAPPYKRQRERDEGRGWREEKRSKRDSRDRRDRSRERDRERDRGRRREYSRDRDREHRRRDDERRRSPGVTNRPSAVSNGHPPPPSQKPDSDREEGEISPRPPSPTPSEQLRTEPQVEQSRPPSEPKPKPELELEMDVHMSEEASRAARRARRQAILAKYAGVASNMQSVSPSPGPPSSAVQPPQPVSSISDIPSQPHSAVDIVAPRESATRMQNGSIGKHDSASPAPESGAFELAKDEDEGKARTNAQAQDGTGEQISAADYDPSLDRREDARIRAYNGEQIAVDVEEVEEEEEEEEEDVDDMFAITTSEKKKKMKSVKKVGQPAAPALITTTLDSAADPEGYYQVILGEQLDGGRYQVFSSLGKGMFANVVRARVLQDAGEGSKEVAIKIIRCQESMYRAGMKEAQILNKLKQADPDDKKHIVRLERTFEHRGHLCLVFESLSMNLRDVVKRFGKDVGLNIKAVRAYAHQLFLALSLLKKTNIMHADIKPDNILVNEQKTLLKLCDLGSASDASENEITPYLVSRFYRAPEIILGVPYDPALDVWSIGCTLYELYTGKILFPGRSNNQMLLLMMELKGRFNTKMVKKSKFGDMFFDEHGGFESIETDRVTCANVVRNVHISKPSRDLRARLMPPSSVKMKDDEIKLLMSFIDLLDKCLALDPSRRLTPKEALVHPFIRG